MYADKQISPARESFHDKQVRPKKTGRPRSRFHILKCENCGEINKVHESVRNPRCWLCDILF
jgi:ribosomal protein S27E